MGKIRFAVIGTSSITEQFLDAAQTHDDFILTAVYSRNLENAKDFANKYDAHFYYDNLDEFAQSKEFDAVYIASPNALHCKQAVLMMNNKKHVLCEKAFALNKKQADLMIDTARKNNVLLVEAMRSTTSKGFLELKKYLNEIGEIRRYFASFCQYSSRYDAFKEGKIPNIFKKEMGAGSLMDIGVYTIAPMINLFAKPKNVIANASMLHTGVDGQGSAIFSYDGFDAIIMHSKISNSKLGIEIQGENGVILADNIRFTNVKLIYKNGTEKVIYKEKENFNDMFYELDDFIICLKNGKTESDLNTLDNSRLVVETIEEVRKITRVIFKED